MTVIQALKPAVKKTAMRSGLMRLASRAGKRKIAVLRYHSVLQNPDDFGESIGSGIIHSSQVFAKQMQMIASRYHPVSLDEVCAFARGEADLPLYSVAITFDDGFADNLEVAAPLLARYGIPASIYLAADYIGNRLPPWYCRLRHAFAVSTIREWAVDGDAVFDMSDRAQRRQAFLDSSRKCAKLCRVPQEELLAEIQTKLKVEPFATPVMLTWEGVRELLRQGHIIGSHTLSHPNLAYIGGNDMTNEITASKLEIERNTQTEIKHFSYPSPIMEPHYSDETVMMTRRAGYHSAVTCNKGAVVRGDDTLKLKRMFAPQALPDLEWALENIFIGRSV